MTLRRLLVMLAVLGLVAGGCGDDDDGGATAATEGDEPAVEDEGGAFDESILPGAIVQAGDEGVTPDSAADHDLDTIWPPGQFPDERAVYEDAGFVAGTFTFVPDLGLGGFSAAHLFPDAAGAEEAFAVVEEWHRDPANAELAGGTPPGDLTDVTDVDVTLGDESVAFEHIGAQSRVAVVVWRNENVVHILRALGAGPDEDLAGTVTAVAQAIDARMQAG